MSNFFDDLEAQLHQAARAATSAPRARAPWWQRRSDLGEPNPPRRMFRLPRGRSRLIVVLAAMLIAGGTAIAAVSLSGQRSEPLSAIVPAGQQPHTALIAGERYTIQIAPSIQAGRIAWCTSIQTFHRSGRPDDLGTGACNDLAPTTGSPVFGADNIVNGGGLSYVFTSSRVAAVKIAGGPTVLTRPDPRLPYGYRAAVFQYKPPAGQPVAIRIPGGTSHLITPLDSAGHELPNDSSGPPPEPTRSWIYPQTPAIGSCSLSPKAVTALQAGSGDVVTSIVPAPTITGAGFLPCIDLDLYLPGNGSRASHAAGLSTDLVGAILLNAKAPGSAPADLPDMHAVAGHPGIYDRPTAGLPTLTDNPGLSAKRVSNAWVVVAGGAGTSQRIAALNDLTVGQIKLSGLPPAPAPTTGSLCQIGYQPVTGIKEISQSDITTTARIAPSAAADQNRTQRVLQAAFTALHRDQARRPRNAALIAGDQAVISLDQQAIHRALSMGNDLFAPTCAIATFYYQQTWPITATLILATKNCPGPRSFVPCDKLRPAWRRTIAKVLKPVPGQSAEFTVPPTTFFHPAETIKQIDKWWLVIDGGKNSKQQQQLLAQLTTTVAPSLRKTLRDAIATPLTFCARQNPTAC